MKWPLYTGTALHLLALFGTAAALTQQGLLGNDLLFLSMVFFIFGEVALLDGLGQYAQWKGYHAGWGVLGLLSMVGVMVVWRLPYRESEYSRRRPAGFDLILLGMDDGRS